MPLTDSLPLLAFVAAVFLLAGCVKGVIGMGLPTVAMGLLSVAMPPAQAAALLVLPSFVTNLWQIAGPGALALWRRLAPMLAGVCVGTLLGTGGMTGSKHATGALGVALAVYGVLGLAKMRLSIPARHEPWAGPAVGLLTGLVTAATGVFVIPAVPYLQALGLEKDELVRALGISFLVSTIALAASLGASGALHLSNATGSLLALLPALVGMGLGQAVRRRVQPETFKKVFFAGLLILGAYLAWRAWL